MAVYFSFDSFVNYGFDLFVNYTLTFNLKSSNKYE